MIDKELSPYYQDEAVTLYHGDCKDVLPTLQEFDLLCTDPPYGINRSGQRQTLCKDSRHNRKAHEDFRWDVQRPSKEEFDLALVKAKHHIVWGGNYFCDYLRPSMGWIVWDKGQKFSTSDCELAYTSYDKALRRIVCNRGAIAREGAIHPTQKPESVVSFCFDFAESFQTVLDPYSGSGTTLAVAKKRGKRAVGIEMNEAYCEQIARRLMAVAPLFAE